MKRNINFVGLSKEHHFGLLCSWKIREGVKKNIEYSRIKNYINHFWNQHLRNHFDLEEAVLPDVENSILKKQMDEEHSQLRQLLNAINNSEDYHLLTDFADALDRHIRLEERVIFPYYEEHLTENQLAAIGKEISMIQQEPDDSYGDEFWK